MRNLLLFAHECAPYHRPESTVGAQRPAHFAKYLCRFGWRAVVLCRDAARQGAGRPDLAEIRERVRAAAPDEPLILATPSLPWDGLLDRAWRASRNRPWLRKPLTLAKLATGDYSQNWQPCAREAAEVVARELRIDACLGEHTPDAGLFLARWFSRRHRVPWIADFRDPILQPFTPFARRIYRPIARRLLSTASATVAVNDLWMRFDRAHFGKPAHVIPNGFDPEEFPDSPLSRGKGVRVGEGGQGGEGTVIAYTGNILHWEPFEVFLRGLALARSRGGAVTFRYRGLAHQRVAGRLAAHGLESAADVQGFQPRSETLRLLQESDLLLVLAYAEPDPYLARGMVPGKVFECFGARRPLLCVPGDDGILEGLLEETRTGTVAHSPEEVAAALLRRQIAYAPDEAALARYSRPELARRLAGILDKIAG